MWAAVWVPHLLSVNMALGTNVNSCLRLNLTQGKVRRGGLYGYFSKHIKMNLFLYGSLTLTQHVISVRQDS